MYIAHLFYAKKDSVKPQLEETSPITLGTSCSIDTHTKGICLLKRCTVSNVKKLSLRSHKHTAVNPMSVSTPRSSTNHTITVDVKIVGVIGCSASGKSTTAHQLARCLHSPLHPISTDQFFFDDVCAKLGTYDDYRCIDYSKIAQWMRTLKQPFQYEPIPVLRHRVTEAERSHGCVETEAFAAWCAASVSRLPNLEPYLCAGTDRAAAHQTKISLKAPHDISIIPKNEPEESNDDNFDDDTSLCAHEAEDEKRRAHAVAISVPPTLFAELNNSRHRTLTPSAPSPNHLTVFVVWEGFTLLCNSDVNACIDYAVQVQCDPETACLRRFFRSPRHHLIQHAVHPLTEESAESDYGDEGDEGWGVVDGVRLKGVRKKEKEREDGRRARAAVVARVVRQLYRPRIEQLWTVRSREMQRKELHGDLLKEVQHVCGSASAMASAVATCFEESIGRLLEVDAYNSPRPRSSRAETQRETLSDQNVCWSEEGIPTRAFQHFWEVEFEKWLVHQSGSFGSHPLSWAALNTSRAGGDDIRSTIPVGMKGSANSAGERASSAFLSLSSNNNDGNETTAVGKIYVERVLAEQGFRVLTEESTRLGSTASKLGGSQASTLPSTIPSATVIANALAPFYYEFRYWFFFEVLYYDRLISLLQAHRLRYRAVANTTGSGVDVTEVERRWWVLENGYATQGKIEGELLSQVQRVVDDIMRGG